MGWSAFGATGAGAGFVSVDWCWDDVSQPISRLKPASKPEAAKARHPTP